jgi:hypothetical protein
MYFTGEWKRSEAQKKLLSYKYYTPSFHGITLINQSTTNNYLHLHHYMKLDQLYQHLGARLYHYSMLSLNPKIFQDQHPGFSLHLKVFSKFLDLTLHLSFFFSLVA